ncbi:hypothetical protein C9374_008035 [Naegleria lovaniensis]|uniref:VWFA domain-containing protein n=1 Tax=Naegleria lovaniensis TaxID=51637 RepID=A0AA88GK76_NAELO|nr:uncharacterized protein C9374_008035 [Naegleria lovaniensis]KAG2378887.1 hypothetical protein C9374_008035 [Naegleria lovaniensis]
MFRKSRGVVTAKRLTITGSDSPSNSPLSIIMTKHNSNIVSLLRKFSSSSSLINRQLSTSIIHLNNSSIHETNNIIKRIRIGSVELYNYSKVDENNDDPLLSVPNFSLFGEDISQQPEILSHLKWMAMKDKLGQDMFLIGHYGELKRQLAFTYCQLAKRKIEYVCITKDTSEHDFKQRREIEANSAYYVDQAAVRAAKNGSILIMDGLEKADRNILPILNNLMENREMALESGTMLISPQRYKQLIEEEGKTEEELRLMKIEPTHEDFRIIAMGLPVPPYEGNTLDPPLRSRFNCRVIDLPSIETIFNSLVNHHKGDPEKFFSFLTIDQKTELFSTLIRFTQSIIQVDNILMSSKTSINTDTKTGAIELLPRFSIENLKNLLEMINEYRYELVKSKDQVKRLFHILYPATLFLRRGQQKDPVEKQENHHKMIEIIEEQLDECASSVYHILSKSCITPMDHTNHPHHTFKDNFHVTLEEFNNIGFSPIEKHKNLLEEMIKSHNCNRDICLVGPKGSGKSLIAHAFASMLRYKTTIVFPLYKEMTSKELLQKRGTTTSGDTVWKNSVLIDAMKDGHICILDGVDRVGTDILLSIQSLIQERVLFLYNGTRYISHNYFDRLMKEGNFSEKDLNSRGIFRIHPTFRVIAIGLSEQLDWLSLELFNMFHFHIVPNLSVEEEVTLLSYRVGTESKQQKEYDFIRSLVLIKNEYNNHEQNQDQRLLSTRDLIRIAKRAMSFKDETLLTSLERTTMTYLLPKHHSDLLKKIVQKYSDINSPATSEQSEIQIEKTSNHLRIGDVQVELHHHANLLLVPKPYFVDNQSHATVMKAMLKDHILMDHTLLIGYQGVGKNKITDQFINLMQCEREYMQLHRDITIASLTVVPSVVDGVLKYIDSPLVRAVKYGRILVLDEIDKCNIETVSILKSLIEDGNMVLGDGRTIVTMKEYERRRQLQEANLDRLLPIAKGFRIIALANPPNFPFHGNEFYASSGDIFSTHFVSNVDVDSEIKLLQSYGPNVQELIIRKLSAVFNDLRVAVEDGIIQYPYSTRELVHIVKHLQAFPSETTLQDAIANVFDFDSFDRETIEFLSKVFQKHEIPVSFKNSEQFSIRIAQEIPLIKSNEGKNMCVLLNNATLTNSCEIQQVSFFINNYRSPQMYYSAYEEPDSGAFATKNPSDKYTNLMEFSELRYVINLPCNKAKSIVSLEDSIHVLSVSSPFGFIHFESNQCDSFTVTELYPLHSRLGTGSHFFSLKKLNTIALMSAQAQRPDRFSPLSSILDSMDHSTSMVDVELYGFLYNPKGNKKFNVEISYQEKIHKSMAKRAREIPFQILTEFTDSHSMCLVFQPGSFSIAVLNFSTWDSSKPVRKGALPHTVHVIHLPFPIDSIKWISSNSFLVLEHDEVASIWRLVEVVMDGNECKTIIKQVNELSNITLKNFDLFTCFGNENTHQLFARPNNQLLSESILIRHLVKRDDYLTVQADLSLQKGNPNISHVDMSFLKKTNQLLLIHHRDSSTNGVTMDVLNFQRNTYRKITPPERILNSSSNCNTPSSFTYNSFVELSNGYVAILHAENQMLLFNLNIDKLSEEALSWQQYNTTRTSVKESLQIEYIDQNREATFPKHGKEDDLPHVGGNTFAGGSGGSDTAGLGGFGGPYRLAKKGNPVLQVSDEVKKKVSKEILERARKMAEEAYQKRLQEIDMSKDEMNLYAQYKNNVTQQIDQLRKTLSSLKWKDEEEERVWVKNQTSGEIDDNKIVEGIVGEKNIYKKRANQDEKHKSHRLPKKKKIHFVMDVSASMYRFNGQDERLDKLLEIAVIIMESFKGFEDRYEYKITGHSGQTSCLDLVHRGKPPQDEKERLKVLLKMHAHSQYCWSGDSTLRAMKEASKQKDCDFVVVFSDANLSRYGIEPQDLARALKKHVFIVFIASMFNEAQQLTQALPSSNGFVCLDTRELSTTFKKILSQNILK